MGRALLVGLTGFGALSLHPSVVAAQEKRASSYSPIEERPPKLQKAIENALKKDYTVVPEAKWNAAAKKLNVTGHGTEDVALIANDQKIDVVITGKLKTDKDSGQPALNIAARHGASGKPVGKLTYDLKTTRLSRPPSPRSKADRSRRSRGNCRPTGRQASTGCPGRTTSIGPNVQARQGRRPDCQARSRRGRKTAQGASCFARFTIRSLMRARA